MNLETLKGFAQKEIRQTLRDARMRMVLFIAPIFQLTLFGVAISNEIKNVKLAAMFDPSDQLTREIYDRSIASNWFVPANTRGIDPFGWVLSGEADAVLIAPVGGLARSIERGHGELQLLVDSRNVLKAQAVENYLLAIVHQSVVPPTAPPPTLQFDVRVLYNPTLVTSVYMVPGVMCMLVCIVTILLTSMSLARERETGTLETLLSAPIKPWEVVLGKTIPFVLLGMIQLPLVLVAAMTLFNIPFRGPLILFFASAFLFVLTTVSLGLLISSFAQTQQQAMMGGFLFLFPAILLSGLIFPLETMPKAIYFLAQINPLTHFVSLLRNILLKGGSLGFFMTHAGALALLAALSISVGLKKIKTTL